MSQRMKKTCEGCKAVDGNIDHPECGRGYDTERFKKRFGTGPGEYYYGLRPTEICPKPRTYQKWLDTPHKSNKGCG